MGRGGWRRCGGALGNTPRGDGSSGVMGNLPGCHRRGAHYHLLGPAQVDARFLSLASIRLGCVSPYRQIEVKLGTTLLFANYTDLCLVQLEDSLCDREAQAH